MILTQWAKRVIGPHPLAPSADPPFFFLRFYFYLREREWGAQRERERKSQADALLSVEPNVGLDLLTLRS